jgi:hypothetical protein
VEAPSLEGLKADAEAVRAEAERLRREFPEDRLERPPGPGRWSAADCFEHLRVTAGLYHPRIRRTLDRARERDPARRRPFRPRLLARLAGTGYLEQQATARALAGRPGELTRPAKRVAT